MPVHNDTSSLLWKMFLPLLVLVFCLGVPAATASLVPAAMGGLSGENLHRAEPVSGRVTDSSGASLPGVTVYVKEDKTIGATTGTDGVYELEVPDNATLVFSTLGFYSQEIQVQGRGRIDVVMKTSIASLNQLVVVGYGTEKKIDLTGSVSAISGDEIAKRQVGQTSMALQGLAPGVTVTQNNGQPGIDGGAIRIRGIGTLNNANPLVLVDGVEMSMNTVDVNSIQSISVLKDAAAAAIYGSKAANGVILITTKRGASGKLAVSYSGYVGFQKPTNLPNMVNGIDHINMLNEAYTNAGRSPLYSDDYIKEYQANKGSDLYPDVDWQKAILTGSGVETSHTVSLSGGSDKFRIFGSLGYLHQDGLLKPIQYERYFVRVNSDLQLSEKFSASMDVFIFNQKRNDVSQYPGANGAAIPATGSGLIFGMMNKLPAVQAVKYANGKWAEGQNGVNPMAILQDGGFYEQTMTPVVGNFSLNYKPWSFLTARVAYSPSFSQPQDKSFVNVIQTYYANGSPAFLVPGKNYMDQSINKDRSDQLNGTLTFSRDYGPHTVTALAGFQYENSSNSGFSAFRDGFLFPQYTVMSAGSFDNMKNNGWASAYTLMSYFGRLNYNYAERYLFEANIRYDGSSRFSQGHKWGIFPSFSVGWRLSEEKFMTSLKSRIQDLKFRASWGRLGNQNIGSDYPFASTVSLGTNYISDGAVQNGAALTTLANGNISWESAEMADFGVDFTILKHLTGSFDYYIKKTTGILLRLNIPQTMGLTAPYQNAGVVRNKGWDLQLDYKNAVNKFRYGVTVSLSDVKNKILDLHGIQNNGTVVNHQGYPINALYLYHATGLISSKNMDGDGNYSGAKQFGSVKPGDIAYEDFDKNGIINSDDKRILGNTIPRYTYSANLYLDYHNFDFSALLQGVGKVDGYLSGSAIIPFLLGGTAYEYQKNRWTLEDPNPHADFPRLAFGETNNSQPSDFWMKSAAYLRVKNLQLGYTLPHSFTNKAGINSLRVYVSAENVFTADDFWPGWDPEISAGNNGAYYPQVKSYNIGLNVNF
jgi:TonB-linked SusC/RagA family outer membrane protein